MIAAGVAAISVFEGFSRQQTEQLRAGLVFIEGGHIRIANQKSWDQETTRLSEIILPNTKKLIADLASIPQVRKVGGRINFFGLMRTTEQSLTVQGMAIDDNLREGLFESIGSKEDTGAGQYLSGDNNPYRVVLGIGLSKQLQTTVGSLVSIVANTRGGAINVIDAEVSGIFKTNIAEYDNSTFYIPLKAAEVLLNTDQAESVSVTLKDFNATREVYENIAGLLLKKEYAGARVKTMQEFSKIFRDVEGFFSGYNWIVNIMVSILVFLGILNTVGMSIYERAGEMGTLQALGESRHQIVQQFALEGAMLGFFGITFGVIFGIAIGIIVNHSYLFLKLPGTTTPVPLQIFLGPEVYLHPIVLSVIATTLSALIPAFRISRLPIVEALRRKI